MKDLIRHLKEFNSKERYYLIKQLVGGGKFHLSCDFCHTIELELKLTIPCNHFAAMDYHIDWIYASLVLARDGDNKKPYFNEPEIIKAHQQDVDFLVAFDINETTHIVFIEAKGVTGWTNEQVGSKAKRFNDIFGDVGDKWEGVVPHFILMSQTKPERLELKDLPSWMTNNLKWLKLDMPEDLKAVSQSDKNGKRKEKGEYWTVVSRQ